MEEQKLKKRMLSGRPKLPQQELKIHRITMLFNESDYGKIKSRADSAGLKPADYAKNLLLTTRTFFAANPRETIEGFKAIAKEINPIGNNLNQLTRHANVSYKNGIVDKETFVKMNELVRMVVAKQDQLLILNMNLLKTRK